MLIFGLTGGIASGKTTVAKQLEELGAYVVDTDIISRAVVLRGTETYSLIRKLFSDSHFLPEGQLNRNKIKESIFTDDELKKSYEALVHPAIRRQTLEQINKAPLSFPYVLVVVPLLFEKGFDEYTDKNIVVDVSESTQVNRAVKRKPSDKLIIENIIRNQMKRTERLRRADYVIENSGDFVELFPQVIRLHQLLLKQNKN